jgi:hypothetical protein
MPEQSSQITALDKVIWMLRECEQYARSASLPSGIINAIVKASEKAKGSRGREIRKFRAHADS